MVRSFSQWKAETVLRLLAIKATHKDDQRIRQTVEALVTRLHYLRVRDLPSFLVLVHHAAVLTDEFLSVLPTEEEVREWFREGEE